MNENDKNKLNSAFEDIDDKFLDEAAHPIRATRKTVISRLVAACAVVALIALPLSYFLVRNDWQLPLPIPPEETEGAEPLSSDSEPEALGTSTPDVAPETTPEETVGVETTPKETVGVETTPPPQTETPPVLNHPEFIPPDLLFTTKGATENMTAFLSYFSYEEEVDGMLREVHGDGEGANGGITHELWSIPVMSLDPDDISIDVGDGTVEGYTLFVFVMNGYGDTTAIIPFEMPEDTSNIRLASGLYYLSVRVKFGSSVSTTGIWVYDYLIGLELESDITTTRIPDGSIDGELSLSANGSSYTAKKYMTYSQRYNESLDKWEKNIGQRFKDAFSTDSEGIPDLEFSPDISFELPQNAKLDSIVLWSGDPGDPTSRGVELNSINEISSYPGTWYAVFAVTYTGDSVSPPVRPETSTDRFNVEHASYDLVFKITVSPIKGTVTVSRGYQTVDTKSFLISGADYDPASDSFMFCDANGFYGTVIAEKAKDLNVFSITRGSEIGYTLPTNATLLSITVYDTEYNELAISSEIGVDFTRLAELPVGKYYVSLEVYYKGYYYPDHDMHEYAYYNEAFTLAVYEGDNLPLYPRFGTTWADVLLDVDSPGANGYYTLYFDSTGGKQAILNALKALTFTHCEPVALADFEIPAGGKSYVITLEEDHGGRFSSELVFVAGKWMYCRGEDMVYELTDEDAAMLYSVLTSTVPTHIDVSADAVSGIYLQSEYGFEKTISDSEVIKDLVKVLNEITVTHFADETEPVGSREWFVTPEGYDAIYFNNYGFIRVNGVLYALSEESEETLRETMNALASVNAIESYNLEEALALFEKGMPKEEVVAIFGEMIEGRYYEFSDGKHVDLVFDESGALADVYYYLDWCDASYRLWKK